MNFLDSLIVEQQRKFVLWVRGIAVGLLCFILGGLGYMAYAFEGINVSTPLTCYVGTQIVWEGVARGTVMSPAHNYPWRFTDAVTGEPVVIGAYCETGAYIYHLKEND